MAHPFSIHTFMLPMRWDYLAKGYSMTMDKKMVPFDKRTDLNVFNKKMENSLWERKFYRINKEPEHYNEYVYFHTFIARTIFDFQQKDEPTVNEVGQNKVMLYYELECTKGDQYIIDCSQYKFELELTGISLHVYNTGIAILTINTANYTYSTAPEILAINEYGRRVYPPFLEGIDDLTTIPKIKTIAKSLSIKHSRINNRNPEAYTFEEYKTLEEKETYQYVGDQYEYGSIIDIPKCLQSLFNNNFVFSAMEEREEAIRFNYLKDDRMFFSCWYGNNALSNLLGSKIELNSTTKEYKLFTSKFWYAFVNGDISENSLGIANDDLMKEHNIASSYMRWADYGTCFGFSRDSFVCISSDIDTLISKKAPNISIHMKSIYYQMAVLTLAQRASILRFSAEVAGLTDLGKIESHKASDQIQKLYLNYIEFINKIYFREVSYQMQGLEIYKHFQKVFNIERDVEGLDTELEELNHFAMMIYQAEQNRNAGRFNILALIFLPATIMFGIYGSNFFDENISWEISTKAKWNELNWSILAWIFIGFLPSIIGLATYIIYNKFKKQ